jgi:hypothetical protein
MSDVVTGGLYGIPGGKGRARKKPPKQPSKPIRVLRAGAAAAARGGKSPGGLLGASLAGAAWKYFDMDTRLADWQFADLERARRIADREVREKSAKIRAERIAREDREMRANQVRLSEPIGAGWNLGAPPERLMNRGYALLPAAQPVPVTYPAGGAPTPPKRRGLKVPKVPPIAAVPSRKAALWAKVRPWVMSPLGVIGVSAVASRLTSPRPNKGGAASDLPAESDLTAVDDYSVYSGNVGGAFYEGEDVGAQLDAELEPRTAPAACEKIEPKRVPGQCRQGWFSETPNKLYLKEWSRRGCG